jgi:putative proteasome-type protease
VVSLLNEQLMQEPAEGQSNLFTVPSLYRAARLVGDAVREVRRVDGAALEDTNSGFNATFILGGQVGSETPRLFMIYPEGNFIEATDDTPYFQLGESKYGKPILDRVVSMATPQKEAAKCVLISFDSTMKSNISVGLPIDLLWYPRDSLRVGLQHRIREGDPYFTMLRSRWGGGLRRVFSELPDPDWLE